MSLDHILGTKSESRVKAMQREIADDLASRLEQTDEEKEKVKSKWFGAGLIEKLQEPTPPVVPQVTCPKGHPVEKTSTTGAWLCQGAAAHKPPCPSGAHTKSERYKCTDPACSWDGMCPEHFDSALKQVEENERVKFMSGYISGRKALKPWMVSTRRDLSPERPRHYHPASFR
ncbi:hypothetical protein DIPPA_33823 [Diplonema papillatum]|nr:hypothetical protein DIPPA_33823 [Diplonema papillatum]